MEFFSLNCPQCGGTLPRQARWRMVNCPYCNSVVTLSEDVVQTARYHQAWLDAQSSAGKTGREMAISGRRFTILTRLGTGEFSDVYLGERKNILPERVTIKIAREESGRGELSKEYRILHELQSINTQGSAYYSTRLPQPISLGTADNTGLEALILRQPVGFWGSLDNVMHYNNAGINPRHVVWMWRRVLEVLGFIHENGWSHGDLHPGHLLVHPPDHGILIIGWGRAVKASGKNRGKAIDLRQSAWSMRALLSGQIDEPGFGPDTPAPLVEVIKRASEDESWCSSRGAAGIDEELKAAALKVYGPPSFVHFNPLSSEN